MIADLYICDRTFSYNGTDSDKEVCRKILNIGEMAGAIREHKDENNLKVQKERFLETALFSNGVKMEDILWGNAVRENHISRDMAEIIKALFNGAVNCGFSYDDMMTALKPEYEDEDNCNGVIAMNIISGIEEKRQVLYDKKGFYEFRRYYIGKYPKNPETFLKNIDKYFDRIVLNKDRNSMESRLAEVLIQKADKIIHCLSALNDSFREEYLGRKEDGLNNINDFLKAFAIRHSVDGGSVEGAIKKKELFCRFDGREGKCYCGPHLKIMPGKNEKGKNHLRIYFCWDENNLEKIYVGLICRHV